MKINFLKRFRSISRMNEITQEEMMRIIKNTDNLVIIDVRSPQEFREGHIYNAINIPLYELENKAEKILKNKEMTIICYCSLGIRSKKAVKILGKLGYSNLYNVNEGIM